jgi:hypothetical protein
MRFALDGYCQSCQQHVEYVVRECPSIGKQNIIDGLQGGQK